MEKKQMTMDDFKVEHVNTGCWYQSDGQKITIAHGKNETHFFDHSRMIDGTIRKAGLSTMDVIKMYVKGQHEMLDIEPWDLKFEFAKFYGTEEFKDISSEYKRFIRWG